MARAPEAAAKPSRIETSIWLAQCPPNTTRADAPAMIKAMANARIASENLLFVAANMLTPKMVP